MLARALDERHEAEQPEGRALAARLRLSRDDRGLTQDQVAQHLGVARTTIVAIEKGERRVKASELMALASLYGRGLSSFLQGTEPIEGFSAQLRDASGGRSDLVAPIQEFQALCEDYLRLETLRRAPLVKRYPPQLEIGGLDPAEAAEDAAVEERRRLGLGDGPVFDLCEVLEGGVGLRIFLLDLPRVAGMYAFTESTGGCVALNAAHSPERRRQTLARAYGQFLASRFRPAIFEDERSGRRPQAEVFAEAFARAFLMPASGIRRAFLSMKRERQGSATYGDLYRLAHAFAVSAETMVHRLEEIHLLPSGLGDRLLAGGFDAVRAMQRLGLPSPVQEQQRLPLRFVTLALESWQEEDLSEGQLAQVLRVSRLKAREILETVMVAGQEPETAVHLGAPLPG